MVLVAYAGCFAIRPLYAGQAYLKIHNYFFGKAFYQPIGLPVVS
jgi:hypothetical protein